MINKPVARITMVVIQWVNYVILFIAYASIISQVPTIIALGTFEVLIEFGFSFVALEALPFGIALLAIGVYLFTSLTLITILELVANASIPFAVEFETFFALQAFAFFVRNGVRRLITFYTLSILVALFAVWIDV